MSFRISPIMSLLRPFRRGLLNLRRSRGFLMSASMMLGIVFLGQLFFVAAIGMRSVRSSLESRPAFSVTLQDAAIDRDAQEFIAAVRQLPFVATVEYVTREKALERARMLSPDAATFFDRTIASNPFHDTAAITLVGADFADAFLRFMQQPQWRRIADPAFFAEAEADKSNLRSQTNLVATGQTAVFLLIVLIGITLFLVVASLVRRQAILRRDDLLVERLSGADEAFIILPFITEAVVLLAVALLFSLTLLAVVISALPSLVSTLSDTDIVHAIRAAVPSLVAMEMLGVIVVGIAGAFVGARGRQSA